jgi:hypothetical protein
MGIRRPHDPFIYWRYLFARHTAKNNIVCGRLILPNSVLSSRVDLLFVEALAMIRNKLQLLRIERFFLHLAKSD